MFPRLINHGSIIHKASRRASAPQTPPDTPAPLHCSAGEMGCVWLLASILPPAPRPGPALLQVSLAGGVWCSVHQSSSIASSKNRKPPGPVDWQVQRPFNENISNRSSRFKPSQVTLLWGKCLNMEHSPCSFPHFLTKLPDAGWGLERPCQTPAAPIS